MVVELNVALVEKGVVEEVVVVEVVGMRVVDDCATELLVLVDELTDPTELVDVEVGEVEPPDDEADPR